LFQGNAADFALDPLGIRVPGTYLDFPAAWEHFVTEIPPEDRGDVVKGLAKIFAVQPRRLRDGRGRFTRRGLVIGPKRAKHLDDDRDCLLGSRRRDVEIENRAHGIDAGRQDMEPAPMRLLDEGYRIEILELEPHNVGFDSGRIDEDPVELSETLREASGTPGGDCLQPHRGSRGGMGRTPSRPAVAEDVRHLG
jgi:hypothetical protein